MASSRVSVLGAGAWGTALAALASPRADTMLWARSAALAQQIGQQHQNPRYLEGIALPSGLRATADFRSAVAHVLAGPDPSLLILGVPVAGLAQVCRQLDDLLPQDHPTPLHLVWTCKGIDPHTGAFPHQIVAGHLARRAWVQGGVLSGPSFAREVAQGLPVALTLASADPATIQIVQDVCHGLQARIYGSTDVIGVEVGGALKNVIAIACGIADGLKLGTNARAALITRGLAEIQRLGTALGGLPDTFWGLAGLGDLVLTATGDLSRNRQVGVAVGQGRSLEQILAGGMTAEGVRCAQAALRLGHDLGIEMPITEIVCRVLFQGLSPRNAVTALLTREPRSEAG